MWGKVQPAVSRFARTVSYDRAGVGLSSAGPLPRDGQQVARELRRALGLAGVPPPYLLVGASIGGPYIRIYAGLYPGDVAGLVLVDPTPDSGQIRNPQSQEALAQPDTLAQSRVSRVPAGVPVFLVRAEGTPEVPFASETIRETRRARRFQIAAESREHKAWIDAVAGGRYIVTRESGHNVPIEQPDLVVDTIRRAVANARSRPRAR
jgi:pimeloyl-ACP methyl ester carboxylesterase